MTWTHSMTKRLNQIRVFGYDARTMAEILGEEFGVKLTRFAVIGKINRMKKTAEAEAEAEADEPRLPGLDIMELREGSCRWLIGTARYCGKTREDGSPYCKVHRMQALSRPK
jgi:hypothetical protein